MQKWQMEQRSESQERSLCSRRRRCCRRRCCCCPCCCCCCLSVRPNFSPSSASLSLQIPLVARPCLSSFLTFQGNKWNKRRRENIQKRRSEKKRMSPVTADNSFTEETFTAAAPSARPSISHPSVRQPFIYPSIINPLLCHPSICQLDEGSSASMQQAKSSLLVNLSGIGKNIELHSGP